MLLIASPHVLSPSSFCRLARQEKHDEVKSFLSEIKRSSLAGDRMGDLCSIYSREFGEEKAEELIALLREKNLLPSTAKGLSGMVGVHLERGDLEKAVEVFERFAKEDRRLPLKFKLMAKLIQLEDMERMQRVLDASISVIGEERSLYDLAHNFLDLGKYAQAKKLFETPGLRYHRDRVEYITGQLKDKPEALEQMVRLTRGLFGCDRGMMYARLVAAYGTDADRVSEAWVMMQEEGHPPSNKLRERIALVLKKAGREVPFDVPGTRRKRMPEEGGELQEKEDAEAITTDAQKTSSS